MKELSLLLLWFSVFSCNTVSDGNTTAPRTTGSPPPALFGGELSDYWYQGEAEISTYDLQQARYGELRQGEAILIQVSEDFLTDKQVKNDHYENENTTPIIKTNLLRRFNTGIYDYSIMTSVFTPTDGQTHPRTLKVTTSSQDWCGQSFTQLNYAGGDAWDMQLRSYFENEGDRDDRLPADFLEDEVFNRIRIGGELPEGTFDVVPSTGYLLITHQPYTAAAARAATTTSGDSLRVYTLQYTGLERRLEVTYETNPPYRIRRWTETYPSRGEILTTTATLRAQTTEPYWQQNANSDLPRRADLGLK